MDSHNSSRRSSLTSVEGQGDTNPSSLPSNIGQSRTEFGSQRSRSQSKGSQESLTPTSRIPRPRQTCFRERSRSEVDFKSINRKRFPNVESKVKRYIDQVKAADSHPRVLKQKSMPELHESMREAIREEEEQDLNNGMIGQASVYSMPDQVVNELEEKERQIRELREWVNTLESNFQNKQEENFCLKRKVEQMRMKLSQNAERRSSAPNTTANLSFYESKIDLGPFTSIMTPVKVRPVKVVASKSVQTSFMEDLLLSDQLENDVFEEHTCSKVLFNASGDAVSATKAAKNESVRSEATTAELVTPTASATNQDENTDGDRNILNKSKNSIHRLHVSFKGNNSYQIFEEDSVIVKDSASNGNAVQEPGLQEKKRRVPVFKKFLNCFRPKKK